VISIGITTEDFKRIFRLEMKGWRPSQNSQPNAGNEIIGLEMTEL
jgi:hypothetical protein